MPRILGNSNTSGKSVHP